MRAGFRAAARAGQSAACPPLAIDQLKEGPCDLVERSDEAIPARFARHGDCFAPLAMTARRYEPASGLASPRRARPVPCVSACYRRRRNAIPNKPVPKIASVPGSGMTPVSENDALKARDGADDVRPYAQPVRIQELIAGPALQIGECCRRDDGLWRGQPEEVADVQVNLRHKEVVARRQRKRIRERHVELHLFAGDRSVSRRWSGSASDECRQAAHCCWPRSVRRSLVVKVRSPGAELSRESSATSDGELTRVGTCGSRT